uniref:Uncharacterized protein n=1 Tax=Arion vulgaris TaxID=1028688 RepID=A0A0B7B363_9EUPU
MLQLVISNLPKHDLKVKQDDILQMKFQGLWRTTVTSSISMLPPLGKDPTIHAR